MSDTKPTNPKDKIGSSKLPLHLWPASATVLGALGLLDGALKYGKKNWRSSGVRASIYIDALFRHMTRWQEGEETDADSGLPHLAHALACLAILVDAMMTGKLEDDREFNGGEYSNFLAKLTPHVERLKRVHVDKNPHHYTIADEPQKVINEIHVTGSPAGKEIIKTLKRHLSGQPLTGGRNK